MKGSLIQAGSGPHLNGYRTVLIPLFLFHDTISSKGCLQRGREAGTPGGVGETGAASPRFCRAADALCRGFLHRVGHGHDEAGQLAAGPARTGTQAEVCARRRRGDLDA